ncbi:MAG: hypothetical protein AAGF89_04605 [Bacteroidota bacterium]
MFFLITYAMLNIVVIIEQRLGLISFRPQFTVHPLIPYLGLIGSLLTMFIINPTISLVSWALMIFVYGILSRRKLETKFEDVRSGLFTSFAEWAAKHTAENVHQQERSWKPNLLIPVTDGATVQGAFSLIKDIAYPKGGAVLMGIGEGRKGKLGEKLAYLTKAFQNDEVFSSVAMMRTDSFARGVNLGNQALTAAFFRPNIVFLNLLEEPEVVKEYVAVITETERLELGAVLYAPHPKAMLGQRQMINVWIRPQGPSWELDDAYQTQDLALLLSYKLKLNWRAKVRVITVIDQPEEKTKAHKFLRTIIDLARLPIDEFLVLEGDFSTQMGQAPAADINFFGMTPGSSMEGYRQHAAAIDTSCLFVLDSGHENIFA